MTSEKKNFGYQDLKISGDAKKYLNKISRETGREIVIEEATDLGIPEMIAAFKPSQEDFIIRVLARIDENDERFQETIIHEAVHGLLYYSKGYYHPEPESACTESVSLSLDILASMVDDIAVNKIMQDKGFREIKEIHLRAFRKEIRAARESNDFYTRVSSDPAVQKIFKVCRYVVVWGFVQYLALKPMAKRIFKRYLKVFEKAYHDEYEIANRITEVITNYDIFAAEGQQKALKEIVKICGFEQVTRLADYS
jgi:hypothetical protein